MPTAVRLLALLVAGGRGPTAADAVGLLASPADHLDHLTAASTGPTSLDLKHTSHDLASSELVLLDVPLSSPALEELKHTPSEHTSSGPEPFPLASPAGHLDHLTAASTGPTSLELKHTPSELEHASSELGHFPLEELVLLDEEAAQEAGRTSLGLKHTPSEHTSSGPEPFPLEELVLLDDMDDMEPVQEMERVLDSEYAQLNPIELALLDLRTSWASELEHSPPGEAAVLLEPDTFAQLAAPLSLGGGEWEAHVNKPVSLGMTLQIAKRSTEGEVEVLDLTAASTGPTTSLKHSSSVDLTTSGLEPAPPLGVEAEVILDVEPDARVVGWEQHYAEGKEDTLPLHYAEGERDTLPLHYAEGEVDTLPLHYAEERGQEEGTAAERGWEQHYQDTGTEVLLAHLNRHNLKEEEQGLPLHYAEEEKQGHDTGTEVLLAHLKHAADGEEEQGHDTGGARRGPLPLHYAEEAHLNLRVFLGFF